MLRIGAHRLIHDPKIQAAMLEYARSLNQAATPQMLRALHTMALEPGPNQLRGLIPALGMAGLSPVVEVHQRHEHVISYDEKLLELKRLARLAGEDPDQPGTISDAEYEEIADG